MFVKSKVNQVFLLYIYVLYTNLYINIMYV